MLDTLEKIGRTKVISILRGIKTETLPVVLDGLIDGGINCIEITMNTGNALSMIEKACDHGGLLVGAGTVTSVQQARDAASAGAKFVLSPILCPEVITFCLENGILPVPGVFTPTEIWTAKCLGAELIKVFPANDIGPGYIKSLLGPMDRLKLLPVGGISAENVAEYFKMGAYAVGVGSCLVDKVLAETKNHVEITRRAAEFVAAMNKFNIKS